MKAKKLAEECKSTGVTVGETMNERIDVSIYQFTEAEFQVFCDQLCREQREICAETSDLTDNISVNKNYILNAPMPEI